MRLLRPLLVMLNGLANLTLRAVRVEPQGRGDQRLHPRRGRRPGRRVPPRGLLDDEEHQRLSGAINFDARDVRAVLLPAERVIAVAADAAPAHVERLAASTGYSRFPARDGSGAPVGYLHLKDVLDVDPPARDRPTPPGRLRPLPALDGRDKLHAALSTMQQSGAHLAQVRDPAGCPLGIVTLEDVLEELVGEVRDGTRRPRQPDR